jgi:hypothetical protein
MKKYYTLLFLMIFLAISFSNITVDNVTDLLSRTSALQPGDTLLVQPGTYTLATWNIRNIQGTQDRWIVIMANGNAIIEGNSTCCNLVQLQDVHYIKIIGFEITMASGVGGSIDGINIKGNYSSHIVLEDLYIHDMSFTGIGMWPDSVAHITLRNSEIARCAGSGIYWGYPQTSIIHDILIEHNYIHHCPTDHTESTYYGIQIKGWCYRARILDNVMHDVSGYSRSGIIVYYGRRPLVGDAPEDMNIVRGNVLWNGRNEGITVMSDALIENNIVFDAEVGINVQDYSDGSFSGKNYVENLIIRNNTVFRCRYACVSLYGWSSAGDSVSFSGNVLYQQDSTKTAFNGSTGSALVAGNVYFGRSNKSQGFTRGNGLSDFSNAGAASTVPDLDFYPVQNAPFVNNLQSPDTWPAMDFNHTLRPQNTSADAGAYEYTASGNPGWIIKGEFKNLGSGPVYEDKVAGPAANDFVLYPNHPNPFNPFTVVKYRIPRGKTEMARVSVKIYDLQGKWIQTLVDEPMHGSAKRVVWDGTDAHGQKVGNGTYIYRLFRDNNIKFTRKMVLIR